MTFLLHCWSTIFAGSGSKLSQLFLVPVPRELLGHQVKVRQPLGSWLNFVASLNTQEVLPFLVVHIMSPPCSKCSKLCFVCCTCLHFTLHFPSLHVCPSHAAGHLHLLPGCSSVWREVSQYCAGGSEQTDGTHASTS